MSAAKLAIILLTHQVYSWLRIMLVAKLVTDYIGNDYSHVVTVQLEMF